MSHNLVAGLTRGWRSAKRARPWFMTFKNFEVDCRSRFSNWNDRQSEFRKSSEPIMFKLSYNMWTEKFQAIKKNFLYHYKYWNMQDCSKIVTPESWHLTFQRTRHITSSPVKHYSLDSEDDFGSGCETSVTNKVFFSELPSPGRSHYTNYWYSRVQTIYNVTEIYIYNN